MALFNTAYSEAVSELDQNQTDTQSQDSNISSILLPSYMIAADTHSIANSNPTFGESAGSVIEDASKFIGLSILSGVNEIYNIPIAIGNMFGADIKRHTVEDFIGSADSDLAKYYQQHQEGIDTVGFIASALVPGLGGIKALHAGQAALRTSLVAGKYGENMGKAFGLLVPKSEVYLNRAINEAIKGNSIMAISRENTIRALGAGLGQAFLESAAFESAVAISFQSSPVLENQDLGDFVSNIIWGGITFGAIGGTVRGTKSYFQIKKGAVAADLETMPWKYVADVPPKAQSYEKIAMSLDQIHGMPKVPEGGLKVGEGQIIDSTTLSKIAEKKVNTLEGDIRREFGTLAGGDQELAGVAYHATKATDYTTRIGNIFGLKSISRMADKSAIEKELGKLDKKVLKKTATLEEAERASNLHLSWTKTWGDDAGAVYNVRPITTSLVDTLKKGESIAISDTTVTAGKRRYRFSQTDSFDALKSNPLEAQARLLWAGELRNFRTNIPIDEYDTALLERLYVQFNPEHTIALRNGGTYTAPTQEDLLYFLRDKKLEVVNKLQEATASGLVGADAERVVERLNAILANPEIPEATKVSTAKMRDIYKLRAAMLTQDEIASMVNVKPRYLSGIEDSNLTNDIFALQSYSEKYTKDLVDSGARRADAGIVNVALVPQHIKMSYDATPFVKLHGNEVDNIVRIKQIQKLYTDDMDRASAVVLGADHADLPEITGQMIQETANRLGAGPGLITSSSGNLGTLASVVEWIGKKTTNMIEKAKTATREALEPASYKVLNDQEAAIEFSALNARLRSIPDNYVLNEAGDALVPQAIRNWERAVQEARALGNADPIRPILTATDAPMSIPIKTEGARELSKIHIQRNERVVENRRILNTSKGTPDNTSSDIFYPIPIDPKDYKHFALVYDRSITGTGHVKTLYATTEEDLKSMITKLESDPNLKVRTKAEAEKYYHDIGEFAFEKTLHDNYLNTAVYRKGVSAPYIIPTDPKKIVNDLLNWHMKREANLVREAVETKYAVSFAELKRLGESFTNVATSQFSSKSLLKYAENVVKNPYADYIKTALGIRNYADYPWWTSMNRLVDDKFSAMYAKIDRAMETAKTPQELDKINATLKQYGYKGAAYDESMDIFSNTVKQSGKLTSIVQRMNSMLATVVLRWDSLNALNNSISANVLLGTETASVIRGIENGSAEAAGALAKLAKVKVPGTDKLVLSPTKIIAESMKRFFSNLPEDIAAKAFYKKHGFMSTISEQHKQLLDNFALKGTESIKDLEGMINKNLERVRKLGEAGEKITGNRLAEEFNRFVAADVMKRISDIGVKEGLLSSKEQLAYINTFVNRTQGNYLAAQRPMMFQGPIGQAIGLFQTYQFNLMQQLLRHVGEGASKDAMTLLALQGTIHGMNGLPAFNAINTHIIGTASGNTNHRDLYDTTYGIVGKQAGDWLMYGLGSNFLLHPDLKVNLYTRGDINPRHVTIIPTDPASVPIVQATGRFMSNLFDTVDKLSAGGDVGTTILQGIEHNGISRPLAGLAQTLEGMVSPVRQSYSTSSRGNVIASNDLFSLVNLARIAGGKPLDEAIAQDAMFRFKAYGLEDARRRQQLGEAIKSTIIAGGEPTTEQIDKFAQQYAELGGKQEQFGKWFLSLYKTANLSQANKLRNDLNGKFSQSMQRIMGGYELRDFTNQ